MKKKQILLVDLDGVLANFKDGIALLAPNLDISEGDNYEERSKMVDEICLANPHIFQNLKPIPGAIEGVKILMDFYDVLFLSTPMDKVIESFSDKKYWLNKHFGELCSEKLILSHRKELQIGKYLIDDTLKRGVSEFTGEHIHFGTEKFPDWQSVLDYLIPPGYSDSYEEDEIYFPKELNKYANHTLNTLDYDDTTAI